jgi:phospholipase/lecithinase/hemolysin
MKKILITILLFFTIQAFAGPYSEIIFFGDSLTDNGNLYASLKVIPKSPPYYEGRFSNGPTWAEYLTDDFNRQFQTEGINDAVGGATAIFHNPAKGALPYILKEEVTKYLDHHVPKSDSLFVIWIGGNDYLDEKREDGVQLATEVVDGIQNNIKSLMSRHAQNFLIIDLPDLSKIPYIRKVSADRAERLCSLSQLHHVKIMDMVTKLQLENPQLKFIYLDAFHLFNDIIENLDAYNQKYHTHLVNTTDACWEGGYVLQKDGSASLEVAMDVANSQAMGKKPCLSPDEYIFWDQIHPTTAVHHIVAEIVKEKLLASE